ncbi:MAG: hypothetical protein DCC71_23165, partial [Proteobacteria bacterium]
ARPGARAHTALAAAIPLAAAAALCSAGPWPRLHGAPNAFSNHKAYHASYDPFASEPQRYRSYLRAMHWQAGPIAVAAPAFYAQLAAQPDDAPLIEYPVPIGDVFSFHFLRQRVHGRPTLGGWLGAGDATRRALGGGRSIALVDDVLGALPDPSRARFASLVRIDDAAAVRASGATRLVVHHDLLAELRGTPPAPAPPLRERLAATLGAPVYEDAWISVFALGGAAP